VCICLLLMNLCLSPLFVCVYAITRGQESDREKETCWIQWHEKGEINGQLGKELIHTERVKCLRYIIRSSIVHDQMNENVQNGGRLGS